MGATATVPFVNSNRVPIRAAVLGTGNIGVDLGVKLAKNPDFRLVAVAGRRSTSKGYRRMAALSDTATDKGLSGLLGGQVGFDVIFDATNADAHREHWKTLKTLDAHVVDLTPSGIGSPTVPYVLGSASSNSSMVTCGGQASAPLIDAVTKNCMSVSYVEVSSSIASRSAGPATRINLDDYIFATQNAAMTISGAPQAKAILILNPVEPPTLMRTTVQMIVEGLDAEAMQDALDCAVMRVRDYVPGFELAFQPKIKGDVVSMTVKVTGAGDFLPSWAGNLDIITAAAVRTALNKVGGK